MENQVLSGFIVKAGCTPFPWDFGFAMRVEAWREGARRKCLWTCALQRGLVRMPDSSKSDSAQDLVRPRRRMWRSPCPS